MKISTILLSIVLAMLGIIGFIISLALIYMY